ncbi:MAG: hypothetical protein MK105_12485 [Crocinitomicaceae bacterium]|nr:hypothetical protein [Crocinitomicaceae bacterium]
MIQLEDYTFGIDGIKPYILKNKKIAETLETQRKLLQLWKVQRPIIHNNMTFSTKDLEIYQIDRLRNIVDTAFSTNPFYNQLYSKVGYSRGDIITLDDYKALPIITKDDLLDNENWLGGNLSPTLENAYRYTTSGSSGKVFTVYRDAVMNNMMWLNQLRFYEQILQRPLKQKDWIYEIYLAAPTFSSIADHYPFFTVSNECPPEYVLAHLKLLKPSILSGFPSYLLNLASLIKDPAEFDFIEAIVTNSEASSQQERDRISRAFGGALVCDEYSSIELSFISMQCPHGNYHLVEDNVRVDIINENQLGQGEMIATNLHNTFLPFIRYNHGDKLALKQHGLECRCGNKFRMLKQFEGRADQILISQKNGEISSFMIMSLYDRFLLAHDSNLLEFQIVQKEVNLIELNLVPKANSKGINWSCIDLFTSHLKELFGNDENLSIKINEMAEILNPSYKRRLIINELLH